MAIRLWIPAQREPGWTTDLPVIHMISDLISSSDGSLRQENISGLMASFEHSAEAFRAAKRIQWALLDYCHHRPRHCLGAAIMIYEGRDRANDSPEQSLAVASAVLKHGKPTQILTSDGAREHLQVLPGLKMRAFPASIEDSGWRGSVHELLWTTPANLERAQEVFLNAAQNLSALDSSVVTSQPTVDFGGAGKQIAPPTLIHDVSATPEPDKAGVLTHVERATEPDIEKSGSHAIWWSLLAAAAIAVLVSIVLFLHSSSPNPKSAAAPEQPKQVVEPPTHSESEPAQPEASGAQKPSVEAPIPAKTTSSPQSTDTPTPKNGDATGAAPASPRRQTAKKVNDVDGFTEKDIPLLIRTAQNNAGEGRYEDARHAFNVVLRLDPGNAEAKQGLRKLDLTEREAR